MIIECAVAEANIFLYGKIYGSSETLLIQPDNSASSTVASGVQLKAPGLTNRFLNNSKENCGQYAATFHESNIFSYSITLMNGLCIFVSKMTRTDAKLEFQWKEPQHKFKVLRLEKLPKTHTVWRQGTISSPDLLSFPRISLGNTNLPWSQLDIIQKSIKGSFSPKLGTLVGFKDRRTNYYLLQKDKDLVTILKFPHSFSARKQSSPGSATSLGSPDLSMIILMTSCSIALLVLSIGLRRRAQRRAKEKLYIKEKIQSVILQQRRRSRIKSTKLN